MRAFVTMRQMIGLPKANKMAELENRIKMAELENRINSLESYLEEVFTDQNDINEEPVCNWS